MANVTITTAANWIPEYWSTLLLETLHKNLVAANLVDRRFEKFGRDGDTIHVPGFAEISATTLTNMTGALTFSANTESVTNIAVNTLAYAAVKVDSAATIQGNVPEMELLTGEIGRAVAQKVDTDVLADLDTATQAVGTDNVDLTDDNVLRAMQYLDDANAEASDRFMVMSPATLGGFRKIDKYMSSLYASSAAALAKGTNQRGYIGDIYNVGSHVTTNLPAGTSGKKGFLFHRYTTALVMQKDISVQKREPHDELADAIVAWTIYGIKQMRATLAVEMDGK